MRCLIFIILTVLYPNLSLSKPLVITCDVPTNKLSDFKLYRKTNSNWIIVNQNPVSDLDRALGDNFAVYLGAAFQNSNASYVEAGHALIKIVHYKSNAATKSQKIVENVELFAEREHPRRQGQKKYAYESKINTQIYQEYHVNGSVISNKLSDFHRVRKGKNRYRKYLKKRSQRFAFDDLELVKDKPKYIVGGLKFGKKYRLKNKSKYEIKSLRVNLRYLNRKEGQAILPLCFEIGNIKGVTKTKITIIDFDGVPQNIKDFWLGRNVQWTITWR